MTARSEHVASWVSRLVQIPSVNPLHAGPRAGVLGETRLAEALAGFFTELGADSVELVEVFEGRPNVFADACGVLRSGNAVVFRIGSDALGTARAIVSAALAPALAAALAEPSRPPR